MDRSTHLKTTTVQRGHSYRYYYSPPAATKPVLLFLHGFPSTSYDWHRQIDVFKSLGYGVVAPDCLGVGGTAKPLDHKEYRLNAMAADVMDVLRAEGIEKVVGVGHDWGSVLLSRVVMLYPEIFLGLIWIAVAFMEPIMVPFDLDTAIAFSKSTFGRETYAYWRFFCRPDAHEIIKKNADSFTQLIYPEDPDSWLQYVVKEGGTAECVEGNKLLGRPSWLSEEEYLTIRQEYISNGVQASLLWYVSQLNNNDLEDNMKIPEERKKLPVPSLVILASRDAVCLPPMMRMLMGKYGKDVEYVELNAGHWVHLERTQETNEAMLNWLSRL